MTLSGLDVDSAVLTLTDRVSGDLLDYAGREGHPDFPCLSSTHNPSSCVPTTDFSPWLSERVRLHDVDGVGEFLWRVRQANPGVGESEDELRARYRAQGRAILEAPIEQTLRPADALAMRELRVALILLAAHEGFTGFIMTGDAPEFVASALAPHGFELVDPAALMATRNAFVTQMAEEMSYWSTWPELQGPTLRSLTPPRTPELQAVLTLLRQLPLVVRAHAVDALQHFSADVTAPRTLASLSRYEVRKRGLDLTESIRLIQASGLVVAATDPAAWLSGWTRRDLLGFLTQCGVGPRNSWSKERLAEVAVAECRDEVTQRMTASGAVQLAPELAEGARQLRHYMRRVRETWRVWLGFGTGVA
ncbi:MAG TPA: hypothetical protein VJQ44_15010 [Gemmatimonadales bacterium]|nr:hypothetical protein [Gemmatimonadales bacterium]